MRLVKALTTNTENSSLMSGTHVVKGENQLWQIVPWTPHMLHWKREKVRNWSSVSGGLHTCQTWPRLWASPAWKEGKKTELWSWSCLYTYTYAPVVALCVISVKSVGMFEKNLHQILRHLLPQVPSWSLKSLPCTLRSWSSLAVLNFTFLLCKI